MSKKHFIALAALCLSHRPQLSTLSNTRLALETVLACLESWKGWVEDLADFCSKFGTNFNRSTFLSACGYDDAKDAVNKLNEKLASK